MPFSSICFSSWPKSQDKTLNILGTKGAFAFNISYGVNPGRAGSTKSDPEKNWKDGERANEVNSQKTRKKVMRFAHFIDWLEDLKSFENIFGFSYF